jgi:hypothetical protein
MTITYTDAANPAGYMEISRIGTGVYFEFQYQFPYAPGSMKPNALSQSTRMGDGSTSTNKGANYFDMPLTHKWITETDWPTVLAAADYLGTDRDCFFSLYPGSGNYKEMYHQGRFKVREPGAYETYAFGMQQGGFMLEGQ